MHQSRTVEIRVAVGCLCENSPRIRDAVNTDIKVSQIHAQCIEIGPRTKGSKMKFLGLIQSVQVFEAKTARAIH